MSADTLTAPQRVLLSAEDAFAPHERTIPQVLARSVERVPDSLALVEPRGRTLTYRELDDETHHIAAGLRLLGLASGDTCVAMLDAHADNLIAWLAANRASVVWVPINSAYKGSILQYVIEHSEAQAIVVECEWVDRLVAIADQVPHLRTMIVRGQLDAVPAGLGERTIVSLDALRGTDPIPLDQPRVSDVCSIMYSAGTEGQPKGVLVPHGLAYMASISHRRIAEVEVVLCSLPFFHNGGLYIGPLQALRTGGTAVLHGTFSASRFSDDACTSGATTALVVGPVVEFLLNRPASPQDRQHSLTCVIQFPVSSRVDEFAEFFGVPVAAGNGCTEFAAAPMSEVGEARPGLCGTAVPQLEVMLADEFGAPVESGEVGELLVRPREPVVMSLGYVKAPEKTVAAWRDLWSHTGDLMRLDTASGQFMFVDRSKDVLRRRGENVSSAEVERQLLDFPGVAEAAVVAVPGEGGEDETRAVLVPVADSAVNPAEILVWLYERLPYFMVPRYYDLVPRLPRTHTMKVQKAVLRAEGMSGAVWDCEAAGFRITRTGLVRPA